LSKKTSKVKKIVKKSKKIARKNANYKNNSSTSSKDTKENIVLPKGKYHEAVGRRKVATARVRIWNQSGDYIVNGQAAGEYFSPVIGAPTRYNKPLEVVGMKGKFTISAQVSGSGISAQIDAVVHALSRALVKYNADLKPLLKEAGLLTRDDRMKETRKPGRGGSARRKRQSPRR